MFTSKLNSRSLPKGLPDSPLITSAEGDKPPPTSKSRPQRAVLDEAALQSELMRLGLPHAAAQLESLRTTLCEGGWVGGYLAGTWLGVILRLVQSGKLMQLALRGHNYLR